MKQIWQNVNSWKVQVVNAWASLRCSLHFSVASKMLIIRCFLKIITSLTVECNWTGLPESPVWPL